MKKNKYQYHELVWDHDQCMKDIPNVIKNVIESLEVNGSIPTRMLMNCTRIKTNKEGEKQFFKFRRS